MNSLPDYQHPVFACLECGRRFLTRDIAEYHLNSMHPLPVSEASRDFNALLAQLAEQGQREGGQP